MEVLIAGYPYIKESYFKTFDYYPDGDSIFFLLPERWKAKGGKVVFYPPDRPNIFKTKALFYHSHYPLIGGVLKGWMPLFPFFLARRKFRIVYSPGEPILLTTLYQGVWSKIFGLKHIIFTWENVPYEDKFHGLGGLIKKLVLRLNLIFCDGVICGNKKAADIIRKFGVKRLNFKTLVCPLSGVDTEYFKPERNLKTADNHELNGKIVYLFAGAIGRRKGIHLIIKAFKRVIDNIPNAHFVLVGSGEYETEIDELISENKLNDRITRIPWLDKAGLKNIMSVSDIFLYPSMPYGGWEEQFGYSMAEASLMELPVISTRSGSIEEVVVDPVKSPNGDNEASGRTGILVEPEKIGPINHSNT